VADLQRLADQSRSLKDEVDILRETSDKVRMVFAVFRIHRIHVCLGLPDPDPLVRGMDPDPSIIMQNNKKNHESYYFVTLFDFLSFKKIM
jgi:hypothetical protein